MHTPFPLPCIIFAGGKSSRMGRNKALLPFGGTPTLAQYQFDRLSPLFAATYLSVKDPSLFPETMPVITDDPAFDVFAPTAGFVAAFRRLKADRIFAVSVDTPFIDDSVITALLTSDRDDLDAVVARTKAGMHPLCGIYHRRLLPVFEEMAASDDHRLGSMLKRCKSVFVDFENETLFANLNHPHDYEKALQILQ